MPVDSNTQFSLTSRPAKRNSGYVKDTLYQRGTYPSARLISLADSNDPSHLLAGTFQATTASQVVIEFPAMPEVIRLARRANYSSTPIWSLPDGIHIYRHTEPLEIPLSFQLSAHDEYCTFGGASLLDIAARLHALVLPISTRKLGDPALSVVRSNTESATARDAREKLNADTGKITPAPDLVTTVDGGQTVFPPVAVLLDLISVESGNSNVGIQCIGFVKDVDVQLKGPWLSSEAHRASNLPSGLDASFTFVLRSSHTNYFQASDTRATFNENSQAFAGVVKDRLYNTIGLVREISYKGFNST